MSVQPPSLPIVQPDAAKVEQDLLASRQPHARNRRCGECTACCTFMRVDELRKPAKTPCPNCTGAGCSIYDSRPLTCRGWSCEWWLGNLGLTDTQRPDKLGLMFSYNPALMVVNECWPGAALGKAAVRVLNRIKGQRPLLFVPAVGTAFRLGERDAREEIRLAGYAPDPNELLGNPVDPQSSRFGTRQ
jgi:hypothetical protein